MEEKIVLMWCRRIRRSLGRCATLFVPLLLLLVYPLRAEPSERSPMLPAIDTVPVAFPQYPAISPDGSVVVFSYAGDLWSVNADGGVAERLTAHPSDELRAAFSPDGSMLAFESERDGPRNIYVMPLASTGVGRGPLVGGTVRRVTISDRPQALAGFTTDGKRVLFTSNHEPSIFRSTRMYSAGVDAPPDGGSRMERLTDAYGASPRAAADGTFLFHRGRYDSTRPKYSGSASTDIYRFHPTSGEFTRLTDHPHNDAEAFPLPDGSVLFISARDGQNNLWKLDPDTTEPSGGKPAQLTKFAPKPGESTIAHGVRDLSVSPGGSIAVFCVWDKIYTLDLQRPNAEPRPVALSAGGDFAQLDFQRMNIGRQLSEAALSPDGKTLAVVARGEIFVRSTEKDRPTRRVFTGQSGHCRARDLAWSPDGQKLYFACDNSGPSGIYVATVTLSREDLGLTSRPERVPETTPEEPKGSEPSTDPTKPVSEPPPKPENREQNSEPTTLNVLPSSEQAGNQGNTTEPRDNAPALGNESAKSPSEKKTDHGKRWSEALTFDVTPLLVGGEERRRPVLSPDGKKMLLVRGLGDLVLVDLETLQSAGTDAGKLAADAERVIVPGWNDPDAFWTADSRHVIYAVNDVYYNSDIWLLDVLAEPGTDAAEPVNLTRHPDYDHSPRLSADGKVLYFLSDRDASVNGRDDIFAIYLDRKLEGLRPYELADYFKEASETAKKRKPLGIPEPPAGGRAASNESDAGKENTAKSATGKKNAAVSPEDPLSFDTDDAYLRVRKIVASSGDIRNLEITPGGERVMFSSSQDDGGSSFVSVDYNGKERKTVFSGAATNISASLTGEKVLFISGDQRSGRGGNTEAHLGRPSGGETEKLPIDAPVTINIALQQRQKFGEATRLMGTRFYHPTLKDLDWPALTRRYLDLAVHTRTDSEFNRLFSNLLGELDGSHMGISGGRNTSGEGQPIGYLGVDVRPAPGGYEITRIVPQSPAAATTTKLNVGEVILSVANQALAPAENEMPTLDFNTALAGTAGMETLLKLRMEDGEGTRHVLITPVSFMTDINLRYLDEVRRRADLVDQWSGGKLGYLHIRGMNMPSVRDFERDLFAAADGKLGLLIDVRDNGGGSTTDILLSSLTAPRHAYTAARGVNLKSLPKDAYPRDRRLIYGYTRPITVLINQNSFSNAEIFAHAIKTIGRGTLVGMPTFGAVISTGAATLLDGTVMRMPMRGWYLPDGTDMENNGAEPHIVIDQTPEDEVQGRDRQLEEAVKELLARAKPL